MNSRQLLPFTAPSLHLLVAQLDDYMRHLRVSEERSWQIEQTHQSSWRGVRAPVLCTLQAGGTERMGGSRGVCLPGKQR